MLEIDGDTLEMFAPNRTAMMEAKERIEQLVAKEV